MSIQWFHPSTNIFSSNKRACQYASILQIQKAHFPYISESHSWYTLSTNEGPWNCAIWWQLQCVIYALAAYIADYEEQVLLLCIVCNWCPKCLVHSKNLDEDAHRQIQKHYNTIVKAFELCEIWEQYEIVGNIIVCPWILFFVVSDQSMIAIYKLLSICKHSWNALTEHLHQLSLRAGSRIT